MPTEGNSNSNATQASTTCAMLGKNSRIQNNVFFGCQAMTIKGDDHIVSDNTGDDLTIVRAWGAIKIPPLDDNTDCELGMNANTQVEEKNH